MSFTVVTLSTTGFSVVTLPTDGFSVYAIPIATRVGELLMEDSSVLLQEDGSSAIVLDAQYMWEAA